MAKLKFSTPSDRALDGNIGMTTYEVYQATDGQTVMNTAAPFVLGIHQLAVHRDGVLQYVNIDYYELDQNTVEFVKPLALNESILFSIQGVYR